MRLPASLLLMCAMGLWAQDPIPGETLYMGMNAGTGVDASLVQKYSQCIATELRTRGALTLVLPSQDKLNQSCNTSCLDQNKQSEGANQALSAEVRKDPNGYKVVLMVSTAQGSYSTDWLVVGDSKALLGDGCKNGAGIIYNSLATPPRKASAKSNGNAEKIRDRGMSANPNIFGIIEEERAAASRGGAASNTNPDSDKSGKTGR